MGKEAELIKAAKKGDLKFLERYLGQQNKRTSVIGRLVFTVSVCDLVSLCHLICHHWTVLFKMLSTCQTVRGISYPINCSDQEGPQELLHMFSICLAKCI